MPKIYAYARVSTRHQSLGRQIANIRAAYPDVSEIVTEKFTGTKMDRPAWTRLFKKLAPGDTVVFDEVSRMSRDADEGFATYRELYTRGVNMVFLKEPHINSAVYKETMQLKPTGADADFDETVIPGLNAYLMRLAERQIKIAFEQAQKEVDHLHKRVSEGMRAANAGEKIAEARTGNTYETRKSREMKIRIRQMSRDFDGTMTDRDVIEVLGLARNSFYKYKKQMIEAQDNSGDTDE